MCSVAQPVQWHYSTIFNETPHIHKSYQWWIIWLSFSLYIYFWLLFFQARTNVMIIRHQKFFMKQTLISGDRQVYHVTWYSVHTKLSLDTWYLNLSCNIFLSVLLCVRAGYIEAITSILVSGASGFHRKLWLRDKGHVWRTHGIFSAKLSALGCGRRRRCRSTLHRNTHSELYVPSLM